MREGLKMTAEQLERRLQNGAAPVVLDVRSRFEYHSGHIPGAIHAPLPGVLIAADSANVRKQELMVIVCEHGPRAQIARLLLKVRGYKNLQLLQGHMSCWRSSGRPMQSG